MTPGVWGSVKSVTETRYHTFKTHDISQGLPQGLSKKQMPASSVAHGLWRLLLSVVCTTVDAFDTEYASGNASTAITTVGQSAMA